MAPPYKPVQVGHNPNRLTGEVVMVRQPGCDPWPMKVRERLFDVYVTNPAGTDYESVVAVTGWGGTPGGESWRTVPVAWCSAPTKAERKRFSIAEAADHALRTQA